MALTMSACSSGTWSQRRSPSGWSLTRTSRTPSIVAASYSSRVRTAPRSAFASSAGSDTDPASPRDAQSSTTRAPASDSRASVPPQASDSSSGCAKISSTVRPFNGRSSLALRGSSATMRLHDPAIHVDVLVHHARHAEALHGARAHARAVESEHARHFVHHLLEVVEDDAGHAVLDDFPDGAAVERSHR